MTQKVPGTGELVITGAHVEKPYLELGVISGINIGCFKFISWGTVFDMRPFSLLQLMEINYFTKLISN